MVNILRNGGAGYVGKRAEPEVIFTAVRDAKDGGTALSANCVSRLIAAVNLDHYAKKLARTIVELHGIEARVAERLMLGESNNQVAEALHYSESGVKKSSHGYSLSSG